ncbi:Alanine-tRNA ligase, class IIc [Artemisia annua]|uniref:Alanine-tRNA ligase, class IIc n=1 Tax=Artemisia annua TaxID=35608 RepID=A0A2U1L5Z1_ARTAN|nr:Alanine-tRNA ligase, class IIc [Artemisia annua]
MGSEEIEWPANKVRDTFIKFFEERNHVYWKSSPVVPVNDPTLLFANADDRMLWSRCSVYSRLYENRTNDVSVEEAGRSTWLTSPTTKVISVSSPAYIRFSW